MAVNPYTGEWEDDDPWAAYGQTEPAPAAKTYNTVPGLWDDPNTAPSPSDPYYRKWREANPGIPESAAEPIGRQIYAHAVGGTQYYDQLETPTAQNEDTGGAGTDTAPPPTTTPTTTTTEPPPTVAPAPAPTGSTGTTTQPGGGLSTPTQIPVSSDWPMPTLPPVPVVAPRPTPAPFAYDPYTGFDPFVDEAPYAVNPFSYDPFRAPTMDEAAQEPGYAFSKEEGIKALENSKAARGILRTGGTLKDILGWGNRFAEQNYGNVYNRSANTYGINQRNAFDTWGANESQRARAYDTNRNNRFQTWGANELGDANAYTLNRENAFGTWKANNDLGADVFDTNRDLAFQTFNAGMNREQAAFAPKQRAAELTFDDMYRRFLAGLNANTSLAMAGANS